MREYRFVVDSSEHFSHLNGLPVTDDEGNDISGYDVRLADHRSSVVDVIALNWHVVASFLVTPDGINLVLNEENGQVYYVEYDYRNNTHLFPTQPPVRISLIDY